MQLDGSCHCGAVTFSVVAYAPYPYLRCHCSICRKTAGGGGYAINLGAHAKTLRIKGKKNLSVYRVEKNRTEEGAGKRGLSPARRHFCQICGSALWIFDPRWPELVHPFASAIDTELPAPNPETCHIMLDYKANWVVVPKGKGHTRYSIYPDESLEDFHKRHGI